MNMGPWIRNIPTDIGITKATKQLWRDTQKLKHLDHPKGKPNDPQESQA